jgi:hypothetical protein
MSAPLNRPRDGNEEGESSAPPAASSAAAATRTGNVSGPAPVQPLPPRPDTGLLSLTTIASHYRIAAAHRIVDDGARGRHYCQFILM